MVQTTYRPLLRAAVLSTLLAACARKKDVAFPYPRQVVAADEQQRYKTALWCAYTGSLDSSIINKKPLSDSLYSTLQGWLTIRRHLKELKQDSLTTCFRFGFDAPYETILRLYNNGYRYGSQSFGLRAVVAVWVNKKDGLVDSVLDINNHLHYAGPRMEQVNSQWRKIGPPDRRQFSYNIDQPCKAAFLNANEPQLARDLLLLCQEKGVIAP